MSPATTTLTTQQAADLLDVSRATVITFIEDGKLRAEQVRGRRSLLLDDVVAFQRARRQAQYDFLAATAVEFDDESDPDEVRAQLKVVRRAVAAQRTG